MLLHNILFAPAVTLRRTEALAIWKVGVATALIGHTPIPSSLLPPPPLLLPAPPPHPLPTLLRMTVHRSPTHRYRHRMPRPLLLGGVNQRPNLLHMHSLHHRLARRGSAQASPARLCTCTYVYSMPFGGV